MTFETLANLARNMPTSIAAEVVPLIGAGLRAKFPNAKPTLEADLTTEFANLQAAYAAVATATASTRALLADLK